MKSYIKLLSAVLLVAGTTTQINASEYDRQINFIRSVAGKSTGPITGSEYQLALGALPKGTVLTAINSRIKTLDEHAAAFEAAVSNEVTALVTAGMAEANAQFLVELLAKETTKTIGKITATPPSTDIIEILRDLDSNHRNFRANNIDALPPFNRAALWYTIADIAKNASGVKELFMTLINGTAASGIYAAHAGVTNQGEILATPEVALANLIKALYDAEIVSNADITDKTLLSPGVIGELNQALLTTVFATLS